MKSHRISFIVLITLYSFYNLIGVFFPGTEIGLTLPTIAIYLLICGVYLIKTLFTQKNNYVKIWMLFLLINVISFIFIPDQNIIYANRYGFSIISIFRTILQVLLSFFPFYYLAKNRIIDDKSMRNVFVIFLIVHALGYFYESILLRTIGNENDQVNAIYALVYLLPFLFFLKRRNIIYFTLLGIFIMVLSSFKRGAFVTFSIGSLVVLYWLTKKTISKVSAIKILGAILIISSFLMVSYILTVSNENLMLRFNNVSRDEGSGRFDIFERLLHAWPYEADFNQLVFGYGFAGTVEFVSSFAHNDLIEVSVNYGLIGLFVYILLWKKLFNVYRELEKHSFYRYCLLSILLIWLFDSMYARFFSGSYSTSTVMVIGYIVGRYELMKNNTDRRNTNGMPQPIQDITN